jgi:hypothetical protein
MIPNGDKGINYSILVHLITLLHFASVTNLKGHTNQERRMSQGEEKHIVKLSLKLNSKSCYTPEPKTFSTTLSQFQIRAGEFHLIETHLQTIF